MGSHCHVTNGRLTQVTPTAADKRPTLMLTEGMLARTYAKTRIAGPMVRKSYLEAVQSGGSSKPELRGKDDWVQVSWDTAIGLSAKAILDTIEKHGNEGCFSSSYGGCIFRPNVLQGRLQPAGRLVHDGRRLFSWGRAGDHAHDHWRPGSLFGADLVGAGT